MPCHGEQASAHRHSTFGHSHKHIHITCGNFLKHVSELGHFSDTVFSAGMHVASGLAFVYASVDVVMSADVSIVQRKDHIQIFSISILANSKCKTAKKWHFFKEYQFQCTLGPNSDIDMLYSLILYIMTCFVDFAEIMS